MDKTGADQLIADREDVRLAGIVRAWNVFQHFYPYFDIVDTDWDEELTRGLISAIEDKDATDFLYTLRKLTAGLHDGHAYVAHSLQTKWAGMPFLVDWVEESVVVTYSADTAKFRVGDVVKAVDGVPAEQVLVDAEQLLSGSPQRKRYKALTRFGYGDEGTLARLVIERNGEALEVETKRDTRDLTAPPERPEIFEIQSGVYYVDLSEADMASIRERIDDLASADGVIFDLRGYPNNNHEVICHLLDGPDTSSAWMLTPRIIYPDRENLVGYEPSGWHMQPAEPRISGKVVFLTDARAISYAESFMGFIEHYKLAEIVGQPTAGTNGNVNTFTLPGGYNLGFTGMRVVKHDGSRFHLIGILPTVPAQRTLAGIREGRDEFLEKALALITD
jgi:hypothetical protein